MKQGTPTTWCHSAVHARCHLYLAVADVYACLRQAMLGLHGHACMSQGCSLVRAARLAWFYLTLCADVHPGGLRLPQGAAQHRHQEGARPHPQVQDLCAGVVPHVILNVYPVLLHEPCVQVQRPPWLAPNPCYTQACHWACSCVSKTLMAEQVACMGRLGEWIAHEPLMQ